LKTKNIIFYAFFCEAKKVIETQKKSRVADHSHRL